VSGSTLLDEIVREGARRMLAAAVEAEVAACIDAHAQEDGMIHSVRPPRTTSRSS
jgi:hypothetical protein